MNNKQTADAAGGTAHTITKRLRERGVHLIDLENLVGSGHVTEVAACNARAMYFATGVVALGDHVIVSTSHHNLFVAKSVWGDARVVARSGRDGADLALQEVMATENLHQRFGRCLLATGDGGFAHPVAALIALGLPVGVIAPRDRLSRALKLAASASCEINFIPSDLNTWSAS
ncbi:hypothetical protein [Mycobacterium sp. M26]|uniref:hypothetical protein n=1 Tax=Mycobacterium sp. M26 TaxID=1762962 RepID=UPI0012E3441F|nr:hypothetical protein [Mycobacterium sp. M26]